MANDNLTASAVAEQMAMLRNAYRSRLPDELASLHALAASLQEQAPDQGILDDLHHRLHRLAGSGGTFGFSALSTAARSLEQRVRHWLSAAPSDWDAQACNTLIADVGALAQVMAETDVAARSPGAGSVEQNADMTQNVWLVADDEQLSQEVLRQLESFNYAVRVFAGTADAEEAAQTAQPDMLIIDMLLVQQAENAAQPLLPCPRLRKLDCPLLFISSEGDFSSRMRAAQLGADGYFLKPLDVPRLVSRMVHLFEQRRAPPQRVLIVDDDEALAAHYRLVLTGAGMVAEVQHQPEAIIEKISDFCPELVLLDLHMPACSGPDLAGVIRQHDNWASLPLVYLSAETDLGKQVKAMKRGADDFLTKPISDAQLIAAVRVRIERARQLDAQISRDSLTGLLKHSSIKDALEQEVLRARRNGQPATVTILDIDNFKQVNDSYGHAAGDVVISSLATLLRQRMRRSDIIGRYGGEEFVAILPECDTEQAWHMLDDIRQRFASVSFSHGGRDFACTLSAGLAVTAQYPDSNGAALLVAADDALYAAKRAGRNQVQSAG